MKQILMGNEAIALGLIHAGVDMISGYDAGTKLLDTAGCSDIYLQASLLVVGKKSFQ